MNTLKVTLFAAAIAAATSLAAAPTDAQRLYEGKCAKCHGINGDGQGKVGKSLDPKPTDFTSVKWQSDMKDEDVVEAITNGSKSTKLKIGKKMTEYGSKLSKEQVQGLVTVIRGFKAK